MARGTRGSGAKNNRTKSLTRQQLIKKHGLATFHPDPEQNRKLQETKGKNIDFRKDYGVDTKGDRFQGDPKTMGGTNKKKPEVAARKQNLKIRLGYPLARGPNEKTGDTLLIKCIEYQPPTNGTGISLDFDEVQRDVTKAGKDKSGKFREVGERVTTGYKNFRMNNTDANTRMNRNQKIKYYVELPIPQEINDSNVVTWGDNEMNIFQLAGIAAANRLQTNPGATFQDILNMIQNGIELPGLSDDLRNAIRSSISGAAINALGANVDRSSLIARATGQVLNSNLELLFGGVNLRTFPFSVTFTPRYEAEMMEVKKIIRQFKMTMAAKGGSKSGGASGIFLKSPDVFSLRYLHNGQDHPFLNSFKMCALTGMNINYTNSGTYASYHDGSPVSIRMNLTFKELNPIYSEDYDGMTDAEGVGF
mgnify:FL=1